MRRGQGNQQVLDQMSRLHGLIFDVQKDAERAGAPVELVWRTNGEVLPRIASSLTRTSMPSALDKIRLPLYRSTWEMPSGAMLATLP